MLGVRLAIERLSVYSECSVVEKCFVRQGDGRLDEGRGLRMMNDE